MSWKINKDGTKSIKGAFSKGLLQATVKESGVYDADTLFGVDIQLPVAWDRMKPFGEVDPDAPEAFQNRTIKNKGTGEITIGKDGETYLKGTTVRLAGFDTWEIKDNPFTGKKYSEAHKKKGREAAKALVKMFRSGWTDPKQKSKFKFLVRGKGNVRNHEKGPYWSLDRLNTDVYIVENGKQIKVGEVVFYSVADKLKKGGHGKEWYPRR